MRCDGRYYGRLVKEEFYPLVGYPRVGAHVLGMLAAYKSLDQTRSVHSLQRRTFGEESSRGKGVRDTNIWRTALSIRELILNTQRNDQRYIKFSRL